MPLKEWAIRKNRELHRKAMEDRDSHLWHSPSYHRYFEGFREVERIDEKGHRKLVREYGGMHYRQAVSGKVYGMVRVLYAALLAVMIGAVVLAGSRQGEGGKAFYVVLPELATVCLLAWMGYILAVNYVPAPRKMTINDYRASSKALMKTSFFAMIAFGLDIVMTLLDLVLVGGYASAIAVAACFLTGALAAGAIHCVEKHIPYAAEAAPAEGAILPGGIEIENNEL